MRTTTDPALNRMEFLMSIKSKIAALALAALAVTCSIASTSTPSEAHGFGFGHGWGIGAGTIGEVGPKAGPGGAAKADAARPFARASFLLGARPSGRARS